MSTCVQEHPCASKGRGQTVGKRWAFYPPSTRLLPPAAITAPAVSWLPRSQRLPAMENPGDDFARRHGQHQRICFSDALAQIRSLEGQLVVAHAHRDRTTERIQEALDVLEDFEPLSDVLRHLRTRLAELIEATAQPPGSDLPVEPTGGSDLPVESTNRSTSGFSITYDPVTNVTTTYRWTRSPRCVWAGGSWSLASPSTQTDVIADAHAV